MCPDTLFGRMVIFLFFLLFNFLHMSPCHHHINNTATHCTLTLCITYPHLHHLNGPNNMCVPNTLFGSMVNFLFFVLFDFLQMLPCHHCTTDVQTILFGPMVIFFFKIYYWYSHLGTSINDTAPHLLLTSHNTHVSMTSTMSMAQKMPSNTLFEPMLILFLSLYFYSFFGHFYSF